MVQTIELTHEEKVAMYMKLPKKQLISMLIECNRLMDKMNIFQLEPFDQHTLINTIPCPHNYLQKDDYWKACTHCGNIEPIQK